MGLKYLECLYKQYCDSVKKEYGDFSLEDVGFFNWIKTLDANTRTYLDFLRVNKICPTNTSSIEFGKGILDSIGKDNAFIISKYAKTMGEMNGELIVDEKNPIVKIGLNIYSIPDGILYLTHNSYDETGIRTIIGLDNIGQEISYGVYGSIYDEDKEAKLEQLRKLSGFLVRDNEICYDTSDDNYFACISFGYQKKLTLVKQKYFDSDYPKNVYNKY